MSVSVLDLALHRGAKRNPDGSVSMGAVEATGLPFFGGCEVCGASIAAHNAAPTTTGYLRCVKGCADDVGFSTVEEANGFVFSLRGPSL